MKRNPSGAAEPPLIASTPLPELWASRPSIQDRLTIFTDSKIRRVVCTLLHTERITPADLKLIIAAPRLARALLRLRTEQKRVEMERHVPSLLLEAAIQEADEALAAAGIEL